MRRTVWFWVGFVAVLGVVLSPAAPADAAVTCGVDINVATSVELDAAVACFNASTATGDHYIHLTSDISYGPGDVVTEVTRNSSDAILSFYGYEHTVTGPGGSVFGENLFTVSGSSRVVFWYVVIDSSAYRGIDVKPGAGRVELDYVTVSRSGGTNLFVGGGETRVSRSRIDQAGIVGVYVGGGARAWVTESTIWRSGTRGAFADVGSELAVTNSTISGSWQSGVFVGGGSAWISNATIADSGLEGVFVSGGSTSVVSSVVADGCTGSVTGSNNVTTTGGGCGTGSMQYGNPIAGLADFGCEGRTPTGCPQTHPLILASENVALDAGKCTGVLLSASVAIDLVYDQRGDGFPRLRGAGCDVGATEAIGLCHGKPVTIDMNVNGGDGVGTLGDDVISGTPGSDVIDAGAGSDTVCGGGGDDRIDGGVGDFRDFLYGGPGNDTMFGGFGIDYINGEDGDDTIDGQGGSDRLFGGPGNDLMLGDSGADRMYGGPGDDEMRGMGGQDFMWGEAGNDLMQGNHQTDNMFGGPGNDTMFGAGGKDSLFGEAGNDSLSGGDNTDYLDGGANVDTANGGRGRDKPLTEPKMRAGNGQFYDGSGCIAETIVNCQPTP